MRTHHTPVIRRDRKALEQRRFKAARLFASGVSQYEVAKRFGVSTAAANHWHQSWVRDRENGLRSKGPPGFDPAYTPAKRRELKTLILSGPRRAGYDTDFWTVERICRAAEKRLGISLRITQTWRTVVRLGFSCQKPERRSKERNESAIKAWRIGTFPPLAAVGKKS